MRMKPGLVEKFRDLINQEDYNALDYWYPKLNPAIKGLERARKCCLITLVSGDFGTVKRDRVHTLLWGEAGTGKSDIRNYIGYKMGGSNKNEWIPVGADSTKVGLKFDARKGVPGILHQAHKGVIVCDELDEMNREDRSALLESMSQGKYEIMKGERREFLDAEVRVIACTNRIKQFRDELLDRFDFVIRMELPSPKEEKRITTHIYKHFFDEEEISETLRKYISYVRPYNPKVKDNILDEIINIKDSLIDKLKKEEGYKADIRSKESLFRTSLCIARLNKERLKVKHYKEGIKLHYPKIDLSF